MKDEIVLSDKFDHVYDDINDLIKRKKCDVSNNSFRYSGWSLIRMEMGKKASFH